MKKNGLDDTDRLLLEWADWLISHGIAEGFGGGNEFDTADRMDMGPRQIGTHSDPVLAEVLRELMAGTTPSARVHRMLLLYPTYHRTLVKCRYVGVPTQILAEAHGYDSADGCDLTIRRTYTGMLPFEMVADSMNPLHGYGPPALNQALTPDKARRDVARVKKWLKKDLRSDRAVRAGLAGIDGMLRAA